MKPSLSIKLAADRAPPAVPHWGEVLGDDDQPPTALLPEIDRIFHRYRLPVWVTAEYPSHGDNWSPDEIASGLNRIYRLVLQRDGEIPKALIDEIRLLPFIEHVHSSRIGHTPLPEPHAAEMSADGIRHSRDAILLDEAHQFTRGDPSITIAVLDTGIDLEHRELVHALVQGYNFVEIIDGAGEFIGKYVKADAVPDDEVGHGTHVAGIIAGKGIAMPLGVAPQCKLLPVRVLGAMKQGDRVVGAGLIDNINNGLKWAVDQGADVINMSLGVRHEGGGLPHQEVVDYASRRGATIVAASGNGGGEDLYYPGALDYVIDVGAVDDEDRVAPFSSWGPQVDLVAPGTAIYSSFPKNEYAFSSGTSHAAPFVTGVVALLMSYARQRGQNLSDTQVKYLLEQTSDKVDQRFKNIKAGFGRLNARDALRLLDHKLRRRSRRGLLSASPPGGSPNRKEAS